MFKISLILFVFLASCSWAADYPAEALNLNGSWTPVGISRVSLLEVDLSESKLLLKLKDHERNSAIESVVKNGDLIVVTVRIDDGAALELSFKILDAGTIQMTHEFFTKIFHRLDKTAAGEKEHPLDGKWLMENKGADQAKTFLVVETAKMQAVLSVNGEDDKRAITSIQKKGEEYSVVIEDAGGRNSKNLMVILRDADTLAVGYKNNSNIPEVFTRKK